jgi:hypothetical protein
MLHGSQGELRGRSFDVHLLQVAGWVINDQTSCIPQMRVLADSKRD